jgi:hypothetical protein
MTQQSTDSFTSNTRQDVCPTHATIFLHQHSVQSFSNSYHNLSPTITMIFFFQHTPQSSSNTHHNHYNIQHSPHHSPHHLLDLLLQLLTAVWARRSRWRGMMAAGNVEGGWGLNHPMPWWVSKMKEKVLWGVGRVTMRAGAAPAPTPSTHWGWGWGSSPWALMCSFQGNGSWAPSQSSSYLGDLRGHFLVTALDHPTLQTPDQGSSDLRSQEVVGNIQQGTVHYFTVPLLSLSWLLAG